MSDLKDTGQVLRNKEVVLPFPSKTKATKKPPPPHTKLYSVPINQLGILLKCRFCKSGVGSEILTVIVVSMSTLKAARS